MVAMGGAAASAAARKAREQQINKISSPGKVLPRGSGRNLVHPVHRDDIHDMDIGLARPNKVACLSNMATPVATLSNVVTLCCTSNIMSDNTTQKEGSLQRHHAQRRSSHAHSGFRIDSP